MSSPDFIVPSPVGTQAYRDLHIHPVRFGIENGTAPGIEAVKAARNCDCFVACCGTDKLFMFRSERIGIELARNGVKCANDFLRPLHAALSSLAEAMQLRPGAEHLLV
jgi:hypothetical protein